MGIAVKVQKDASRTVIIMSPPAGGNCPRIVASGKANVKIRDDYHGKVSANKLLLKCLHL